MNQFSASISNGIKAAHDARVNISEIRAVIAEISEAVDQLTDGKIAIFHQRIPVIGSNVISDFIGAFADLQKDDVLSFKRTSPPLEAIEIGRLEIPSSGYPCSVKFAGKKMACFDRASLVTILQELLSTPDAGKALLKLREMPDKKDEPVRPATG